MNNDILNTAFYLESDDIISYAKHTDFYCIHNLNKQSTEKLMNNLDIGSWILWIYKDNLINKKLNAITIKTNEGLVHHKNFIFQINFQTPEVLEISITQSIIKKELYIRKEYHTMTEFLYKLKKVYGLNLDKQVIYEDDNDFC